MLLLFQVLGFLAPEPHLLGHSLSQICQWLATHHLHLREGALLSHESLTDSPNCPTEALESKDNRTCPHRRRFTTSSFFELHLIMEIGNASSPSKRHFPGPGCFSVLQSVQRIKPERFHQHAMWVVRIVSHKHRHAER